MKRCLYYMSVCAHVAMISFGGWGAGDSYARGDTSGVIIFLLCAAIWIRWTLQLMGLVNRGTP